MCQCSWGPVQTPNTASPLTWPPSPWRRVSVVNQQPTWRPVSGALLPEETKGLTMGWRNGGRPEWLRPRACHCHALPRGLGHGASVESVLYGAAPAAWLPPQAAICLSSLWNCFSGAAVLLLNVFKQFNTDWARSCTRHAVWLTESNSIPRKEILCLGESLLFS